MLRHKNETDINVILYEINFLIDNNLIVTSNIYDRINQSEFALKMDTLHYLENKLDKKIILFLK
jgi:hypothetical protein